MFRGGGLHFRWMHFIFLHIQWMRFFIFFLKKDAHCAGVKVWKKMHISWMHVLTAHSSGLWLSERVCLGGWLAHYVREKCTFLKCAFFYLKTEACLISLDKNTPHSPLPCFTLLPFPHRVFSSCCLSTLYIFLKLLFIYSLHLPQLVHLHQLKLVLYFIFTTIIFFVHMLYCWLCL